MFLALNPATIEKTLTECVMDLKEVIVLDGIEILPDYSGFRLRRHDLHGPLPEIVVENSGDTLVDKDRLRNRACWLMAMVELRAELARFLPGCKLVPPTSMDGRAIMVLRAGPRSWLAEGEDFLGTYHQLHKKVVGAHS